MNTYTGIGSQTTPKEVLNTMFHLGFILGKNKWKLYSGAADGADCTFERGCDHADSHKQIFLPWEKFNNHNSPFFNPPEAAFNIAKELCPYWNNCKQSHHQMFARNVQQVLGLNLDSPTHIVICYTKDGKEIGGTRSAIQLANVYDIPVINLGSRDGKELLDNFLQAVSLKEAFYK